MTRADVVRRGMGVATGLGCALLTGGLTWRGVVVASVLALGWAVAIDAEVDEVTGRISRLLDETESGIQRILDGDGEP